MLRKKRQLNINRPGAVRLAAILNYVPGPSMSAVFVYMRTCLFLVSLESPKFACIVVSIRVSYSGGGGLKSRTRNRLFWLKFLSFYPDKFCDISSKPTTVSLHIISHLTILNRIIFRRCITYSKGKGKMYWGSKDTAPRILNLGTICR
jgi:hypothetical protein